MEQNLAGKNSTEHWDINLTLVSAEGFQFSVLRQAFSVMCNLKDKAYMTIKKPTSYKVFIAVISITTLVFLTAMLFVHYQVDKKYSMVLAFLMFVALAFTTVGIFSGFKFTLDETKLKLLNRIGLIGNFLIFAFTIALMAYAALTKANS